MLTLKNNVICIDHNENKTPTIDSLTVGNVSMSSSGIQFSGSNQTALPTSYELYTHSTTYTGPWSGSVTCKIEKEGSKVTIYWPTISGTGNGIVGPNWL